MNIEAQIRKLARSHYYQEIYQASQTNANIQLFENVSNFSGYQQLFLYWLRCYHMIYNELYNMEWENLDEEIIKDDDRCDAFLFWRSKENEKRLREYKKEERKNKPKKSKNSFKIFTGAKNKNLKEDK